MAHSIFESSRSWEVEDIFDDLRETEEELTKKEKIKQVINKTINHYMQGLEDMIREFRLGKISHEIMALQLTRLTAYVNDEVLDYVTT